MMENYDLVRTGSTQVLAFSGYPELEKAADRTAAKIKEGFMEMGYILKVARDTDILAGSRYSGYEEFAGKRYGLDKGTVSRYIRIVERFSVGGNSHMLEEGYRNIGFAKLSLMLHMPDAIAEEITEKYSKAEVQEIKEEIDAEHAVTDLEVAIEAAEDKPEERERTLLERTVRQIGREKPILYHKLHDVYLADGAVSMVMDVLAPQGDAIHMVRIPGMGRLMLSISGENASVTNVRSGDKERYTAYDVWKAAMAICRPGAVKESYLQEYGEPMETGPAADPVKKDPAAPVQQKEKRRESKVTKAAPKKTAVQEKKSAAAVVRKPSLEEPACEPVPGQMELGDYPDVIPDAHYEEIPVQEPDPAAGAAEKQAKEPEAEKDLEAVTGKEGEPEVNGEEPETVSESQDAHKSISRENTSMELEEGEIFWMEVEDHLDYLKQWAVIWNYDNVPENILLHAYRNAVDMAAAIEKLMKLRRVKNV